MESGELKRGSFHTICGLMGLGDGDGRDQSWKTQAMLVLCMQLYSLESKAVYKNLGPEKSCNRSGMGNTQAQDLKKLIKVVCKFALYVLVLKANNFHYPQRNYTSFSVEANNFLLLCSRILKRIFLLTVYDSALNFFVLLKCKHSRRIHAV